MINYEWVISAMDCKLLEETLENVVNTIHWRLKAFNDSFNAETYGAETLSEPSDLNFTLYEDLTKEQVVSWLVNILDVEAIKKSLDSDLQLQENPIIVNLPLPFSNE